MVRQASAQYKNNQDVLYEFLTQHVKHGVKAHGAPSFSLTRAYNLYLDWCKRASVKHSYGRSNFGVMLEERGFHAMHGKSGARAYYGELLNFICVCGSPAQCTCFCGP